MENLDDSKNFVFNNDLLILITFNLTQIILTTPHPKKNLYEMMCSIFEPNKF